MAEKWLSEYEKGWITGLFEGEGSVYIDNNGRRAQPTICVVIAMTDEDTVRKAASVVGYGAVQGPYQGKGNRKPAWRWRLRNRDQCLALLDLVYNDLSERRRAQVDVIRQWDADNPRRYKRGSRSELPAGCV